MATYFSLASQCTQEFCRTDQRFVEESIWPPGNEWRLLNEINLQWLAKVLPVAVEKMDDLAWLDRLLVFSAYLRCVLDGRDERELDVYNFTEFPEPF